MDSNRIKSLATGVRDALRTEASARLEALLAEGSVERLENDAQVRRIEASIAENGRDEVVDRAAYTWFNRLCALRFMDANGYTPTPVVTPRPGSTQPAILSDAAQGVFDPEYVISQDVRVRVTGLLSGAVVSDNAVEDAYDLLLGAVCEHYAGPMGYLFAEDVTSSLLMPQGLLAQGSILSHIVSEMDEDTCSDVEVLGWLYQFYISGRKKELDNKVSRREKLERSEIAPYSQLFTPDWIVQFLAENSLGRLWLLNNPDSELAALMDCYFPPKEDEPHMVVSSADEIRVLDPACGSGHILVYAFDLLFRMYEEEGWPTEDIPQMILRNNLFGLEIDRRAAEIASFALEMKAREFDSRFFEKNVDAQITILEPVELLPQELELVSQLSERRELLEAMAHMDEVGSLYLPDPLDEFVLQNELEHVKHDGSLFAESVIGKLGIMLANIEALSRSFHCVIANPPYVGSGNMNAWMSAWAKSRYPEESADLCACFITRSLSFAKASGYGSLVTMDNWMFKDSYKQMRRKLLEDKGFVMMAHLGPHAFEAISGERVQATATVFLNESALRTGMFLRLDDLGSSDEKKNALLSSARGESLGLCHTIDMDSFESIPSWPIAYWASTEMLKAFSEGTPLGSIAKPRKGLGTGDKDLFMRLWWEVARSSICFDAKDAREAAASEARWFPHNKGGSYRKWYGNCDYVVDWSSGGDAIKRYRNSRGQLAGYARNEDCYYQEHVSWSDIGTGDLSFRWKPKGTIFNEAGPAVFTDHGLLIQLIGFLNSSVVLEITRILSPGMHFQTGRMGEIPVLPQVLEREGVSDIAGECISLARADWDSFETSWDFIRHPLSYVNPKGPTLIAESCSRWEAECRERFNQLKANEEELNRIFARIYHMEGMVPIEVPDDKVSVRLADRARDARSLVSYIVGCLFGRYSWECGALAIANQGEAVRDYCSWSRVAGEDLFFVPDYDNVLPVLADEWFDDDVVTGIRRWLAHVYGTETLEENVTWLEEALGKDLRSYMVRDFYADHLKTYQKRPIYWMFQSPRKAFQCLVYMHRYDEATIGTILTGYLRPLAEKLRTRLQVLESPSATAADTREASKVRGMIAELEQWEHEVVYPLAHERVTIDLNDGVKVNYNKFPRALAKVPGLSEWK